MEGKEEEKEDFGQIPVKNEPSTSSGAPQTVGDMLLEFLETYKPEAGESSTGLTDKTHDIDTSVGFQYFGNLLNAYQSNEFLARSFIEDMWNELVDLSVDTIDKYLQRLEQLGYIEKITNDPELVQNIYVKKKNLAELQQLTVTWIREIMMIPVKNVVPSYQNTQEYADFLKNKPEELRIHRRGVKQLPFAEIIKSKYVLLSRDDGSAFFEKITINEQAQTQVIERYVPKSYITTKTPTVVTTTTVAASIVATTSTVPEEKVDRRRVGFRGKGMIQLRKLEKVSEPTTSKRSQIRIIETFPVVFSYNHASLAFQNTRGLTAILSELEDMGLIYQKNDESMEFVIEVREEKVENMVISDKELEKVVKTRVMNPLRTRVITDTLRKHYQELATSDDVRQEFRDIISYVLEFIDNEKMSSVAPEKKKRKTTTKRYDFEMGNCQRAVMNDMNVVFCWNDVKRKYVYWDETLIGSCLYGLEKMKLIHKRLVERPDEWMMELVYVKEVRSEKLEKNRKCDKELFTIASNFTRDPFAGTNPIAEDLEKYQSLMQNCTNQEFNAIMTILVAKIEEMFSRKESTNSGEFDVEKVKQEIPEEEIKAEKLEEIDEKVKKEEIDDFDNS